MLKLLNACLEEMSKFNLECSSFEAWLTVAEQKLESSRGQISKPESLEQREAVHKVSYSVFIDLHYILGYPRRLYFVVCGACGIGP